MWLDLLRVASVKWKEQEKDRKQKGERKGEMGKGQNVMRASDIWVVGRKEEGVDRVRLIANRKK